MYWRRRFVLLASIFALVVLIAITVHAVSSNGQGTGAGQTPPTPTTSPAAPRSSATPTTTGSSTTSSSTAPPSSTASTAAAASTSGSPSATPKPPPPCAAKDLAISAVVGKSTYSVGDTPLLQLQVVNKGARPCVQDLADKQVEMRVYNGESRVWGSHDCQVQAGNQYRTLAPGMPVRVAITWSARTSQPGCAGTRQRVGAGTYTLYTALAGHTGTATQFAIN